MPSYLLPNWRKKLSFINIRTIISSFTSSRYNGMFSINSIVAKRVLIFKREDSWEIKPNKNKYQVNRWIHNWTEYYLVCDKKEFLRFTMASSPPNQVYHVEHLATFSTSSSSHSQPTTPKIALQRLFAMEKSSGIWTQRMSVQIEGNFYLNNWFEFRAYITKSIEKSIHLKWDRK